MLSQIKDKSQIKFKSKMACPGMGTRETPRTPYPAINCLQKVSGEEPGTRRRLSNQTTSATGAGSNWLLRSL